MEDLNQETENQRFAKLLCELENMNVIKRQQDFVDKVGADKATISQIKNGKISIPNNLFGKIQNAYEFVNVEWIKTGEGDMFKPEVPRGRIRYWVDVDATGGFKELSEDGMTGRYIDIDIPEFRECHDACNIYGDSMAPLYKNGQIIILREWTENFIEYGNVYLIITKSGNRMVKFLKKGSDDAHVLCASENPDYDPFEIERADILKLYVVKGGISKNAL